MSQNTIGPTLTLNPNTEQALKVIKALSSPRRLQILEMLGEHPRNVSEIANAMDMPLSTANLHINALEDAGLLLTEMRPGERGLQKVCARAYTFVVMQFSLSKHVDTNSLEIAMPVGAFVDSNVSPTCGMASSENIIGMLDDPASFYEPGRTNAQLIWFHQGYIEYRFPNRLPSQARVSSLQLSMEICSEAPLHHDNWPSDITVWINDVDIGTWTSPADFGGQRGLLTPRWWETNNTQYGLLKVWQVREEGSFVDGVRTSETSIKNLNLVEREYIAVRLGIKPDAKHIGGLNLFGQQFGNYPQDIILSLMYS